jgi:hypothetical protein
MQVSPSVSQAFFWIAVVKKVLAPWRRVYSVRAFFQACGAGGSGLRASKTFFLCHGGFEAGL